MSSTDISNREIVIQQLQRLRGYKKMASGGWMMVQCPFHDDNSPSCGVRIAEPNIGVFNCLACEAKGGWNKFAEKTGLETIKEWNKAPDVESLVTAQLDDQLLGESGTTFKQVLRTFDCLEATLWPERIDWRGFPGWFMRKLGAHIINDYRADSVSALFPVKVAGKVRGGVKASFVKDERNKRALAYVTSSGPWAQDYGLFPYVYARSLVRKNKTRFVVICEGPRDAMRLCLNGIPAVSVLGAKNFTDRKLLFVIALNVDCIYVMPDSDKAGRMLWRRVKELCSKQEMKCKRIKLPDNDDGSKMDPGNAPKKILRLVMRHFNEQHGFEIPDTIY